MGSWDLGRGFGSGDEGLWRLAIESAGGVAVGLCGQRVTGVIESWHGSDGVLRGLV